jgi:23S rRNA pseudouridine1911/1915/1917 synthase
VGFPVVGDPLYAPPPFDQGSLQLHAAYMSFAHPVTGDMIELYAAPPEDFRIQGHDVREQVVTWS